MPPNPNVTLADWRSLRYRRQLPPDAPRCDRASAPTATAIDRQSLRLRCFEPASGPVGLRQWQPHPDRFPRKASRDIPRHKIPPAHLPSPETWQSPQLTLERQDRNGGIPPMQRPLGSEFLNPALSKSRQSWCERRLPGDWRGNRPTLTRSVPPTPELPQGDREKRAISTR